MYAIRSYYALLGANPKTLAEYLAFCGRVLDRFQAEGGKSVKVLSAYHRPLLFEADKGVARTPMASSDAQQVFFAYRPASYNFV